MYGPEQEERPQEPVMESNTNSEERLALLREWIDKVGASKLEDTEAARRSLNIIRTLMVTDGAPIDN
jgi:hypothetical protein